MKLLSLLSIFILLACNNNSNTATPSQVTDSPQKDGTVINKTPEVDTTGDMLTHSVIDNKAWEQKKAAGIAWLGIGTEPFWSIERKKDSIIFQLSDWEKPIVLKAIRLINLKDSVVYSAQGSANNLQATFIPGECSDGMSDRKYDYSVKVIYNGHAYKGCAVIF